MIIEGELLYSFTIIKNFLTGETMKRVSVFIFLVLFVCGCSHTNELMKYDIKGKNAFYEVNITPNARVMEIEEQNTTTKDEKKKQSNFLESLASASSEVMSAEKIARIKDIVDTEDLAYSINDGLKNALEIYIEFNEVESGQEADFIVKTKLEKCKMTVAKDNVYISVNASAEIIDRATGNIVWDNWETGRVPVRQNYGNKKKAYSNTETKLLTALQLVSLSEKEINVCVADAAEEIGQKMGETFREDLTKKAE